MCRPAQSNAKLNSAGAPQRSQKRESSARVPVAIQDRTDVEHPTDSLLVLLPATTGPEEAVLVINQALHRSWLFNKRRQDKLLQCSALEKKRPPDGDG
jgi:hypothetical protein